MEFNLLPQDIQTKCVLFGSSAIAGIIVAQDNSTTGAWAKFASGGQYQPIDLISSLEASNTGSNVDWSFLTGASSILVAVNFNLVLDSGEANVVAGVPSFSLNTADLLNHNYYNCGCAANLPISSPTASTVNLELSTTIIFPVFGRFINFIAEISALNPGSSNFSSGASQFYLELDLMGYQ